MKETKLNLTIYFNDSANENIAYEFGKSIGEVCQKYINSGHIRDVDVQTTSMTSNPLNPDFEIKFNDDPIMKALLPIL